MRLSKYFIPTLRETPSDASVASHRLMLRTGMIYQTSSGIYSWLPMGLKVMKKIENIIREEQNNAGALEILMPTIQPFDLWEESGRKEAYGEEKLMIKDRHDRDYVYAPTAEEVITDIFRNLVHSYKALPQIWYQIQWKFRDEIRPRFGVMRGREFYMKDCYSFDTSEESSKDSYKKMFDAYLKTFKRMGITAVPVRADSGEIGGDLSHEFNVLAKTGENAIFYHKDLENSENISLDDLKNIYAATDEMHDAENCPVKKEDLRESRGIEVGHIFYLGDKYSEPLNAKVATPDGKNINVHMGCYGIGVSRLVGAIIEANYDEKGIIWPNQVAPYHLGLINLRQGDDGCDATCEKLYKQAEELDIEILYDDRKDRAGVKFSDMDLIGIPWQIIIGPRGIEKNEAELKNRKTGEKLLMPIDQSLQFIKDKLSF